ncbi:MAG TPA: hypothetical protein VNS63_21700 [Blastocatellia bacterium]|nr:hypothetical protein [Blastocatellia bacterium]
MKRMPSVIAMAVISVLAFSSLAISAPKPDRGSKHFTLDGRVIRVDQKARTLLVDDKSSDKLYLVKVPDGKTFKITFGLQMHLAQADISQVHRNDRVRIECKRLASEHLARLEDGRQAIVVIAGR